jgi:hypothetical protein
VPTSIQGSNTQIVLEALRLIDEETHKLKKPDADIQDPDLQ